MKAKSSAMAVSMVRLIFELPEPGTIKDKRRVVSSVKRRLATKFRIACAEIDLQDSLSFAQIGGAYVSNSRALGERVMQRVLSFVENDCALRVHDVEIHTELYN